MPPPPPLLLPLLLLLPLALANDPPLLFAQSSVFQFTVGTSMPIAAGANGALAVNLGYQFNYALPSNLSQLEPTGPRGRVRRGAERPGTGLDLVDVYLSLEDTLQRHGWGDARQCMLRTICELAEAPLHGRADHVLEEIIHLLLTPSEDGGGDGPLRQYEQAELLGRSGAGQCGATYAGCLGSPLDAFTVLAAPP